MIEEVIKDIKESEARAESLQKEAYEKGKEIVFNAETDADKMKKQTLHSCKAEFKFATAEADKEAASERERILSEGEAAAIVLQNSKQSEIERVSDKILAELTGKYCK